MYLIGERPFRYLLPWSDVDLLLLSLHERLAAEPGPLLPPLAGHRGGITGDKANAEGGEGRGGGLGRHIKQLWLPGGFGPGDENKY